MAEKRKNVILCRQQGRDAEKTGYTGRSFDPPENVKQGAETLRNTRQRILVKNRGHNGKAARQILIKNRQKTAFLHKIATPSPKFRLKFGFWAVLALLLPIFCNNSASAVGCADVMFVFARGSGAEIGGAEVKAWEEALRGEVVDADELGLKFEFYELGSKAHGGYQYPAVSVGVDTANGIVTALGAVVDAEGADTYNDSVEQGVQELLHLLAETAETCPGTQFVLGGYSQGAMVISQALTATDGEQILYAATFGDPQLYLPEGAQARTADATYACLGEFYSPYRAGVPDCNVYEGILGGLIPYAGSTLAAKTGAWCNMHDFMCGSSMDLLDLLGPHTSYHASAYRVAAFYVANRVKAEFGPEETAPDATFSDTEVGIKPNWLGNGGDGTHDLTTRTDTDMKILLDLNGLSTAEITEFVADLKAILAECAGTQSMRFGIYLWGGLDGKQLLTLSYLGSTLAETFAALDQVASLAELGSWTNGEIYQSISHALYYGVMAGEWYPTTNVITALVTNNDINRNADFSADGKSAGEVFAEVVTGIRARDPDIKAVGYLGMTYAGAVDYGIKQAAFMGSESIANLAPMNAVTEEANGEIAVLSEDGEIIYINLVDKNPKTAGKNIPEDVSDVKIVGVIDNATLSAEVSTEANPESTATVTGILGEVSQDSAEITVRLEGVAKYLVVVGGALLGITDEESFTLVNIDAETEIKLIPYDADGIRGSIRSLVLPAVATGETVQVQNGIVSGVEILAPNTGGWSWRSLSLLGAKCPLKRF